MVWVAVIDLTMSLYTPAVKHYYECTNKYNKEQPHRALVIHLVERVSTRHASDADIDSSATHPRPPLQSMKKNRDFEAAVHLTYFRRDESYSESACSLC